MAVEAQIIKQVDHIASIKEEFENAMLTRSTTALWDMVDAAAVVAYENRVKGSNITTIDDNVQNVVVAFLFSDWVRLHNEYFAIDAGLTDVTNFVTAINTEYRWRLSEKTVNLLGITTLSTNYIFPDHLLSLGTYAATGASTGTFTDGSAIDVSDSAATSGPGIVVSRVINQAIDSLDLVMSVTCEFSDDTTVAIAVTHTALDAIATEQVLGAEALTANYTAATDDGDVDVAATAQFKVGEYVLIRDDNELTEIAEVQSITTNTLIRCKQIGAADDSGLRNDFTTANNAVAIPLFQDITAITNSNGTSGDDVEFFFQPDRTLDITAS